MMQVYHGRELIQPRRFATIRLPVESEQFVIEPRLRAEKLSSVLVGQQMSLQDNIELFANRLLLSYERMAATRLLAEAVAYALADFEEQTKQLASDIVILTDPAAVVVSNDRYGGYYKFLVIVDRTDKVIFVVTERIQLGRIVYMPDSIVIADKSRAVMIKRGKKATVEVVNELICESDLLLAEGLPNS